MQDHLPALSHQPPLAGYHHPDDVLPEADHALFCDAFGEPLDEYTDPITGKKWLCHPGQGDFV